MKKSSHHTNRKLVRLLFTMLVLAAWVTSCGQPGSVTPVTEEPPTESLTAEPTEEPTTEATEEPTTEATEEPTAEPTEEPVRIKCEGGDGNYTCQGLDDHVITLSDVPAEVTPFLLEVSDARRNQLINADRKDTGCIFLIAGDLVFYDQEDNLIEQPDFSSPVKLSFMFTSDDMAEFDTCRETLLAQQLITESTPVEYLPVYFHDNVWQPFNNEKYEISADNTVTIAFTSWGDQPIGGGTRP